MAITKVSHSLTTDPIDPTKHQMVIQTNTTGGIIIDIVTNIGGGDPIGRIKFEENADESGSVWIKIEEGKIITVLSRQPANTTPQNQREHYTNWRFARYCILESELCYLTYSSATVKDAPHRIYPFVGFKMQSSDVIIIEINVAAGYSKIYYSNLS